MTTALEIEKAIERLPELEQRKVAQWFEDHRLIVASSATLSAIYEEEDGGQNQLTSGTPKHHSLNSARNRANEPSSVMIPLMTFPLIRAFITGTL